MIDYIILAICIFFLGKKVVKPILGNKHIRNFLITTTIALTVVGIMFVVDAKIKEHREVNPSEPEAYPCLDMTITDVTINDPWATIYDSNSQQIRTFYFGGTIPTKFKFKDYWAGRNITICYDDCKDDFIGCTHPVAESILWYE